MCGCLLCAPTGDVTATQACALTGNSNQWPFGFQAGTQSTELHQQGLPHNYFIREIFTKNVLLEHSQLIHLRIIYGCFHITTARLNSDRDCMACKVWSIYYLALFLFKIHSFTHSLTHSLTVWLFTESFLTPVVDDHYRKNLSFSVLKSAAFSF